jgi:hypothetical protein
MRRFSALQGIRSPGRRDVATAKGSATMGTVEPFAEHDARLSRETPLAEKLVQALELMQTGISWKRAALQRQNPEASATEIDSMLRDWLSSDD